MCDFLLTGSNLGFKLIGTGVNDTSEKTNEKEVTQ